MDRGDTLGNKINWQETSKALGGKQKMLGGAENNRALKGEMAISLWGQMAISLWEQTAISFWGRTAISLWGRTAIQGGPPSRKSEGTVFHFVTQY